MRIFKKGIREMLRQYGFSNIKNIDKINIWFTNSVYSIDDKYILKICVDKNNEHNFKKEEYFYGVFQALLPVPKIRVFARSKYIENRYFMIYDKVVWDNLYAVWHLMSEDIRLSIIKQLTNYLKIINKFDYSEYGKKFDLDLDLDWKRNVGDKIEGSLIVIQKNKLLDIDFIIDIRDYLDSNIGILSEQRIWLIHRDIHFDNILVRDNKIVALLDLEMTELGSIDFQLDIIWRMQRQAKKYACEEYKKYVKNKDHKKLMNYFKLFYPELFCFYKFETRLDIYDLEHDLRHLISWPKYSKDFISNIKKILKVKNMRWEKMINGFLFI